MDYTLSHKKERNNAFRPNTKKRKVEDFFLLLRGKRGEKKKGGVAAIGTVRPTEARKPQKKRRRGKEGSSAAFSLPVREGERAKKKKRSRSS